MRWTHYLKGGFPDYGVCVQNNQKEYVLKNGVNRSEYFLRNGKSKGTLRLRLNLGRWEWPNAGNSMTYVSDHDRV